MKLAYWCLNKKVYEMNYLGIWKCTIISPVQTWWSHISKQQNWEKQTQHSKNSTVIWVKVTTYISKVWTYEKWTGPYAGYSYLIYVDVFTLYDGKLYMICSLTSWSAA